MQISGDTEKQDDLCSMCQEALPPTARKGIELFNTGHYFEAHEELELAWRAEPRRVRDLYQGILQVGVAYYHALRQNYTGSRKLFLRARRTLEGLPDTCQGVDLRRFRQDWESVETEVIRLGAERLYQLNPYLMKPIPMITEGASSEQ